MSSGECVYLHGDYCHTTGDGALAIGCESKDYPNLLVHAGCWQYARPANCFTGSICGAIEHWIRGPEAEESR